MHRIVEDGQAETGRTRISQWTLAAWAAAGMVGLTLVTALRRPAAARPRPVPPVEYAPVPGTAQPSAAQPGAAQPGAAQPISVVVGFDNTEPARRALSWGADLLRARPGTLHVVYADHPLIDSDLSGFAHTEMEDTRDQKAADIAAAAGVPYTFERRQESPADAILAAASVQDAAEPGSSPVIVTGRSHHAAHQIIGSVPVRLLHQSRYPVLTIA